MNKHVQDTMSINLSSYNIDHEPNVALFWRGGGGEHPLTSDPWNGTFILWMLMEQLQSLQNAAST
jgi:hypothetical protein